MQFLLFLLLLALFFIFFFLLLSFLWEIGGKVLFFGLLSFWLCGNIFLLFDVCCFLSGIMFWEVYVLFGN